MKIAYDASSKLYNKCHLTPSTSKDHRSKRMDDNTNIQQRQSMYLNTMLDLTVLSQLLAYCIQLLLGEATLRIHRVRHIGDICLTERFSCDAFTFLLIQNEHKKSCISLSEQNKWSKFVEKNLTFTHNRTIFI
jgi:hypothetical protein